MTGSNESTDPAVGASLVEFRIARNQLTYSLKYKDPVRRGGVRFLEWLTGHGRVMRLADELEAELRPSDHRIWQVLVNLFGLSADVSAQSIAQIPQSGPVIIVANHPYGIVDSVLLCDIIARRRTDYKVLSRDFLTEINDVLAQFTIPVPFATDPDWRRKSIQMRNDAMQHLMGGGVLALFPGGDVGCSKTFFGEAEDNEWSPFTAQLIKRSGAKVIPIRFHGQNSRTYQIARKLNRVVGQGLLLGEAVAQRNTEQTVTVGKPLSPGDYKKWEGDPRGFMEWLRKHTHNLSVTGGCQREI